MRLTNVKRIDETKDESLEEMARPAQLCPKCGKSMAANHYWRKGMGWQCKGGAGKAAPAAAPSAPASAPAAAAPKPTPAPAAAAPTPTPAAVAASAGVKTTSAGFDWVKQHNKNKKPVNFSVRPDGAVDVEGTVDLSETGLQKLPVRFGTVNGNFMLSSDELTDVAGVPEEVTQNCLIDFNEITTFVGAPRRVGQMCSITGNPAASLEGLPEFIGQSLYACEMPNIKSLQGIHKIVKNIGTSNDGRADFVGTPIQSHVLGLLLIRNLAKVTLDNKQVMEIINKHLAGERDIDICQDELIDAGLAEFAKI